MSSKKRDEYEKSKKRLKDTDIIPEDKERILEFLDAKDPDNLVIKDPDNDTKKPSTLYTYSVTLRLTAQRCEQPLHDISDYSLNSFFQSLIDGSHDAVSDDGLSANSVSTYQSTARKFFRYHDDIGVDPDNITLTDRTSSSVDDQDMFTRDDLEAMRNVITNPRDRCLFELFVNTGQRITAIQTLRIKDVDPQRGETGAYRHNTEADGLKGANETGIWRPLLAAKTAVKEWMDYHPNPEPEAYLITQRPGWSRESGATMLNQYTINRILQSIAEEAEVNKPANAHNFRHTFTTVCKRDYNLDNDTIKWLLGHRADSTVMETTYSHLTDEDFIKRTEVGAGAREEETESTFTPAMCPTCSEPLPDNAKACSNCGSLFTPDAEDAKSDIEDRMFEGMVEAEGEDERDAVEALRQFLKENPSMVAEMLNDD